MLPVVIFSEIDEAIPCLQKAKMTGDWSASLTIWHSEGCQLLHGLKIFNYDKNICIIKNILWTLLVFTEGKWSDQIALEKLPTYNRRVFWIKINDSIKCKQFT